jgi:hypothetical protein
VLVLPLLTVTGTSAVWPQEPSNGELLSAAGSSQSTNWAGYAATSGPFTSVSASWVEPTATCTSPNGVTYSSFWVGLDGDGSNTVEQTGTEVNCAGLTPEYNAWYEMYPKPSHILTPAVAPGDDLTATVTSTGDSFTLILRDITRHWTRTEVRTSATAEHATAEVITEALSLGTKILPLTDFGSVQFSDVVVDGAPIGDVDGQAIVMASGSTVKAQPSALQNGEKFGVMWLHS